MKDRLTIVGSGDAFGSGGRFNTCMFVELCGERFFIDFGSSSLIALKRMGIAYGDVDKILISHLHADHAGGLPSLLLEAMIVTRRKTPLTIAGPPGTCEWIKELQFRMYPGSERLVPRFDFCVIELTPGKNYQIGALCVTPHKMQHTPETNPSGLRIESAGRILSYTGDSEWTDEILVLADGADILVSECYAHERKIPMHMCYGDIQANRHRLTVGKLVLTHAGPDMLNPPADATEIWAEDGLTVEF